MRRGFLLGGVATAAAGPNLVGTANLVAAAKPVDNLLGAALVRERRAAGATVVRIEADFVTCSQ